MHTMDMVKGTVTMMGSTGIHTATSIMVIGLGWSSRGHKRHSGRGNGRRQA
ncbi:hypothetical protein P353_11865 [Comamonas testosteroni]|uniref:Uncharacterized protein n=1 Tax=Comamonas testosteroni TaxID=285 RepID=A0A096FHA7_COMTE|nr:hypothetical protein P353_11865 [Comamonas testosteroni]